MPSPYVFCCFAQEDGELVARLVADLRTKGIDAWGPSAGADTAGNSEQLASAWQSATTILFVASPRSVVDPEVLAEVEVALATKRRVLSVLAAPLAGGLPRGLARLPHVDFCDSYASAFARLCTLLASPSARATPPHAYYAYGRAPDASAWSTFPESSSADQAARAHTPYPYVQSQRYAQVRAGHSLEPVNASLTARSRTHSSVAVATACVAVAASVLVFVALVGGATKTQRLRLGSAASEVDAGLAAHPVARPSEDWLGTWRSACSPSPYGASTWTTLRVEATRLVAEVSDCDPNPASLLRFEWRLDAARSRGDGQHELDMHFQRLQALPRRTAADWNAARRFGRHDWVDGVPADIAPAAASPAFALVPGASRHELAALRGDTLSLAASLSLALVDPSGSRPAAASRSELFTRLAR